MSVETRNKAIYDFFKAGWATETRTEPIAYPNMPHSPPENTPWVRINILETSSENPKIGRDWKRTLGIVIVQVFVPLNTGDSVKSGICDAVLKILENKKTGQYIEFQRGTVTDDGTDRDGAWWQARVIIPFRYEEQT